ncbi:MAG: SWIM zinc finger family protein [Chloroflexi bacterium]|nr:SWIM zinc finger family protein [Chloroflexota bacterium]MCH8870110.1 SWIM zinc finger family protein [Chloroflexota bacterium]MCH9037954.1 SWIM zinc finger family protein [Chloroflexota bacterium]MCI0796746.1 SWIM zinc finger family protein [Chloroflexota bacterium]MCI0813335.1 SWIM zinc finger family protein [Chloroflexota bacterium]
MLEQHACSCQVFQYYS